jgi:hypothetical protein
MSVTIAGQDPRVYDMITVPDALPRTTPVAGLIAAIEVSALDHVPPGVEFVSVPFEPWQIVVGPPKVPGGGVTVTVTLAEHPVLVIE